MRFFNTVAVVRNLLAAFGVVALILLTLAYINVSQFRRQLDGFDIQALQLHKAYLAQLVATGDSAAVTLWKAEIRPELTPADIDAVVQSAAARERLGAVDQWPAVGATNDGLTAPAGAGVVKLYLVGNDADTATSIIGHNDAFAAYLPWRISLVRDRGGQLWLYTRNMDLLIHGGTPLPPGAHDAALRLKRAVLAALQAVSTAPQA